MNIATKILPFQLDGRYVSALSFVPEKRVQPDKTVSTNMIPTDFFLDNDIWHVSFFVGIAQFEGVARVYQRSRNVNNLYFNLNNPNMNTELKFIVHQKLFSEDWSLRPLYCTYAKHFKEYAQFINENYPHINSLLELDLETVNDQWLNWLQEHSIPTEQRHTNYANGKPKMQQSQIAGFFKCAYRYLYRATDDRNEWDKDIWDVRRLYYFSIKP